MYPRFAQFFASPLLNKGSLNREIEAVDSGEKLSGLTEDSNCSSSLLLPSPSPLFLLPLSFPLPPPQQSSRCRSRVTRTESSNCYAPLPTPTTPLPSLSGVRTCTTSWLCAQQLEEMISIFSSVGNTESLKKGLKKKVF